VAEHITALGASPEVIAINKAKVDEGDEGRVSYQTADLFEWEPEREYDLVSFAFWLSHVPLEQLDSFLAKVARAVRPGGHLFILDEPAQGQHLSGPVEGEMHQTRRLLDGREFSIIKIYYEPDLIAAKLAELGFKEMTGKSGDYFFHLSAIRA
jgi:demethylmenaquinone methyltransferase/2-methoxy-6-polyprenyl-1,4-benzoquinol methylase